MNSAKQITRILLLLLSMISACKKSDDHTIPVNTYPEGYTGRIQYQLEANYNYDYYVRMQKEAAAWSIDTLRGNGTYTVMTGKSELFYNYVLWQQDFISDLMQYLILPGSISFKQLPMGRNQPLKTLSGTNVYVSKYTDVNGDTLITVNGNKVVAADAITTNGFIQTINAVFPPALHRSMLSRITSDTALSMFAAAIQRAGLSITIDAGVYTVMAPMNSAFISPATADLGIGISSMDSLLKADPAILKTLVQNHLLTGLHFTGDMAHDFKANNADTVYYPTAGRQTVKYYRLYDFYDYLYGQGSNVPAQYQPYTPKTYQPFTNEVAGKSILNRITQILAY